MENYRVGLQGALEWASSLALQAVKASKCLQREQQQQTEALFGVVQAAYLTALQLMRHGLPAQQLLHALGIKQTLSPQVLTHRRPVQEQQATVAGRPMNRVAVLHNVIPGDNFNLRSNVMAEEHVHMVIDRLLLKCCALRGTLEFKRNHYTPTLASHNMH